MIRGPGHVGKLIKMAKNHGGYFVTTFLNNSLPLLFLPILTRYLEPAEYANIALFNFYLALSNTLSGTSLPAVISKHFFDSPKEYIAKIIGNSIRISFFSSFTLSFLMLISYKYIGSFLDLPLIWLLLIPWGSFCFVILSMTLTVFRNKRQVLMFSYYTIGNTFINIIISLVLVVLLMWGWQGRVSGILAGFVFSAIFSLIYLIKNDYLNFSFSKRMTKNILGVVVPLLSTAFQTVIISRSGIFFIQLYFSKEILGVYSVAFQLSNFIHLLFLTIYFSWSPYVYDNISNPKKLNRIQFTRLYYFIAGLLVLGVVFLSVFSGFILKLFTTENYMGAKEFIPWLAVGTLFNGLYVFLMPILIKKEKQKAVSIISMINIVVMVVLNIVFIHVFGYMGVAYAYTATFLLMFILIAIQAQKVFPLPWLGALIFLKNK